MKNTITAILAYVVGALLILPCLLTVSVSTHNGYPTIWNLVGLLYTICLVLISKKLLK